MSTDEHLDALLARYPDTMNTAEMAEVLRVNEETVRRMLNAGKLPGIQIGRHWVAAKSELRAFLSARHNQLTTPQGEDND
jgi:excisionase family DNA binding protein